MESRAWIKQATDLIEQIRFEPSSNEETQKEVTNLFKLLENPTLPSAYRLRDASLAAGYTVTQSVLQRLSQHEHLV